MKLNQPTSLTQGTETFLGILEEFKRDDDGLYFTIFVERKRPAPEPEPEDVEHTQPPFSQEQKNEIRAAAGLPPESPARALAPESFDAIAAGPLDGDEESEPVPFDELSDEDGPGGMFELDLSSLPIDIDTPGELYVDASATQLAPTAVDPQERLEALLEPYSADSIDKAYKLLKSGKVVVAKTENLMTWFNVQGSTLYVCKITRGADFLFAECSCPNGMHRGGDAICYHSIAARVAALELTEEWLA